MISASKSIANVAEAYGIGGEVLSNCLKTYREVHGGTEGELRVSERARTQELV